MPTRHQTRHAHARERRERSHTEVTDATLGFWNGEFHRSESRPAGRVAHRPQGSNLLAREGLGNRRAWVFVAVAELVGEGGGELPPAGDLELAVHATEVGLGGLGGDEQRLRDLAIR
jgi:hypothetical protein